MQRLRAVLVSPQRIGYDKKPIQHIDCRMWIYSMNISRSPATIRRESPHRLCTIPLPEKKIGPEHAKRGPLEIATTRVSVNLTKIY